MDGNGKQVVHPHNVPVILRFDFQEPIGTGNSLGEVFQVCLEAADTGIFKNRVKGLFLYFNTPGGAVNDADQIYLAVQRFKERFQLPVYAFIDGLCASGGMYIASSADKIYATTVSEIGSVGVITRPFFNFSQVLDKIGVQSKTISAGKDKDEMNPFRTWKADEGDNFGEITQFFYNHFVNIVTNARQKISKEDLIDEYGAKLYVAPMAKKLGFIDEENMSYFQTMTALCKAANIDPSKPYQVMEIIQDKSAIEKLLAKSQHAMKSMKMAYENHIKLDSANELAEKPLYILPQR